MRGEKLMLITIILIFVFGLSMKGIAQNSTATFLYWQPSARSYAMGGIGSSLTDDIFSAYYNPSGLAFSEKLTIAGSFVNPYPFFGNIANSFFGISLRINKANAIGFSTNLFWMGKQIRTYESSPDPAGVEDTPVHWNAKLSYSYAIFNNLSVGLSAGILKINLSDYKVGEEQNAGTTTTFLFDAGIQARNLFTESTLIVNDAEKSYSPFFDWLIEIGEGYRFRGFSIGMSVSNLGPDISYVDKEQSDSPPSKLLLGLTYNAVSSNAFGMLFGVEYENRFYTSTSADFFHLGGELKLFKILNFRMGYFMQMADDGLSYITYGGGISLKYLNLNIARYNRSIESTWHFDLVISLEF